MYTILGLQNNAVCNSGFTNLESKVNVEKTWAAKEHMSAGLHVFVGLWPNIRSHLHVTMEASEV